MVSLSVQCMADFFSEIDVPVEELVTGPLTTPQRLTRLVAPTPESAPFSAIPRTRSRMTALSEVASTRSAITTVSSRPSTLRTRPAIPIIPAESSGLRRLHLSSSASTSSVVSAHAVSVPRPFLPSTLGPQARSPTAAKMSATVSIGRPRLSSPSPSPKTTQRSMSGPPKQLVTRPSPKLNSGEAAVTSTPAAETMTTRANGLASKSTNPTGPEGRRELKPTRSTDVSQEAGPSRSRPTSATTMTSVRSKPVSLVGKAPLSTSTGPPTPSRTPTSIGSTPRTGNKTVIKSDLPTRSRTSSISKTASVRGKVPAASSSSVALSKSAQSSTSPRPIVLASSRIAQNVKAQPVPLKTLCPATASRLRSASNASTASKGSYRSRLPPNSAPMPVLKPSVRSPSSSTDEPPEARTPLTSQIIDPIIRREGSDGSEFARSVSPVKEPLLVDKPRQVRKLSSSSTKSAASVLRPHPTSAFDPPKRMRDTLLPSELEITDGSMPFCGPGLVFNVGIPCIVSLSQKRARFKAQVKYIGHKDGVSRL